MIGTNQKGKIVLAVKTSNGRFFEILPMESEEFIDYIFWDGNKEPIVNFEKVVIKDKKGSGIFAKIIPIQSIWYVL